jgi:NAD(P)-dependent dehydrogenase (short-subunit alcohol dehydrogenase family)
MVTEAEQRPMRGRTALVTGGTGGIGYQTARVLARRAHRCSSPATSEPGGAGRRGDPPRERSGAGGLPTGRPRHRRRQPGAGRAGPRHRHGLDVLVNNVGGLYQTHWETADGYEATLAMNYVGPVYAGERAAPPAAGQRPRPLCQRGVGRLQDVEARSVPGRPVNPAVRQWRRLRPHQAAQRAVRPRPSPAAPRRAGHRQPRPLRHVVDAHDAINDVIDHAGLAASLAVGTTGAAAPLAGKGPASASPPWSPHRGQARPPASTSKASPRPSACRPGN